MEALFSPALASFEAWISILAIIVFLGIYLFDGIALLQRVIVALRPPKKIVEAIPVATEDVSEVTSPLLEPIAREEVEAHEAEKKAAEEVYEQEIRQAELLEEKLTEEVHAELAAEEQSESLEEAIETEVREDMADSTLSEDTTESTEAIEANNNEEESGKDTSSHTEVESIEENTEEYTEDTDNNTLIEKESIPSESGETLEVEVVQEVTEDTAYVQEDIINDITSDESNEEVGLYEEIIEETPVVASDKTAESTIIESSDTTTEEASIPEDKITETIQEQKKKEEERITEEKKIEKKIIESKYTEKLYAIVTEVKTLIARGNTLEARALIIQGLAYDKNHRELNLILGSLYESERQPQKAEYVYKDLALIYPEDGEILERLANILIIEKRYDLALEIYKKISSMSGETEGSLYIMTHLAHELGHNEELYAYARRYQKNWPNNPEILSLLAESEIALGERQAAIQTLIKLKNLTPYNNEIMDMIAKLKMEEELAGNFGNQ